MIKFRRGDTLDVELVFANKVEIKDLHIYFVHEEDENEHIYWGLQRKGGATEPIPPASETRLRWDKHIEEGKKLGVYVLDTMNFLSSDDTLIEVADSLEDWKFEVVSAGGLLKEPKHIERGIERMITLERESVRENPEREIRAWSEKLAEADRKRSRYQDMAAEGHITFDELRAKLADLGKVREAAGQELENLKRRKERLEELEKDRDALLESWAELVPASLETLTGLERNTVYRMLNLLVSPSPEGYEISGAFCTIEPCGSS